MLLFTNITILYIYTEPVRRWCGVVRKKQNPSEIQWIPRRAEEALNTPQSQPPSTPQGAWIEDIFNPHTPPRRRRMGPRWLAGMYHSL